MDQIPIILRIDEVVRRTTLSKRTIYSMIDEGTFPKPFKLSVGINAWLEDTVNAWIANQASQDKTNKKHGR